MAKFKVGDKVRVVNPWEDYTEYSGMTGIIKERENNLHYWSVGFNNKNWNYFSDNELELINQKSMKTNYILIYDTPERDPVEYFETEKQAKDKIAELVKSNGVIIESIKLYKVEKIGVVAGLEVKVKFD